MSALDPGHNSAVGGDPDETAVAAASPDPGAGPGRGVGLEPGTGRHPWDPEPVRASKARAVWWLGLLGLLTGPLIGGVVPATVALALAGQFWREAHHAGGFLTGAAQVRRGEWLAWLGIVLATAAVAAAAVIGLFQMLHAPPSPRFPSYID